MWAYFVVRECEYLADKQFGVLWSQTANAAFSDSALCVFVSLCVFLKESKACKGKKLASAANDNLDEYLIALQRKNR